MPLLVVDVVLEIGCKVSIPFISPLRTAQIFQSLLSIPPLIGRFIVFTHSSAKYRQRAMGSEFVLYSGKWCETTHTNCKLQQDPIVSAYLHIMVHRIWRSYVGLRATALVLPLRFCLFCYASWLSSTQVVENTLEHHVQAHPPLRHLPQIPWEHRSLVVKISDAQQIFPSC